MQYKSSLFFIYFKKKEPLKGVKGALKRNVVRKEESTTLLNNCEERTWRD